MSQGPPSDSSAVLIVGAGIVGLTIAQALKQRNIPFHIYERDPTPTSRGQGWSITLHWSIPWLHKMLPSSVIDDIRAIQVDPAVAAHDNGNFLFINLATGEPKFKIPPSQRWRVNREKMRLALLRGVEEYVSWGKRVVGVDVNNTDNGDGDNGVGLRFEDGSYATGLIVIGVEGSRSVVRRMLRPDAHDNQPLPVRFTGVAVDLSPSAIQPLRDMDPLLFQGCHPDTGTFFWFSMLETPAGNGTAGTSAERYRAQICMSWPVRSEDDEVASTDMERLENMKRRADAFVPFLRDAVRNIPDGTEVMEIKLADWECLEWENRGGSVTLAGDAAHAMTMYRGEAANHGLLDAYHLVEAIARFHSGEEAQKMAIDAYETEMRRRTKRAVRLSHQACLDAHAWDQLNEHSAILTKRAIDGGETGLPSWLARIRERVLAALGYFPTF